MSRPVLGDLKRRRLPSCQRFPQTQITQLNDTTEPLRKKPKLVHPDRPPPAFWDNLSEIPLTRNALRELDRRNAECSSRKRALRASLPRRPITRRVASERKLAPGSIQPATQYLDCSSSTELKRIRNFARHGGPDLSNIRAYHYEPTISHASGMSSKQSSLGRRKRDEAPLPAPLPALLSAPLSAPLPKSTETPKTTSTKTTGPYDRAFHQHLVDHGVYPNRYEYPGRDVPPPPDNLEEIVQALAQRRRSLSPSRFTQDDFERFARADAHASKEWQVVSEVLPIIEGAVEDNRCFSGQIPLKNLDHLTDGSLVPGNPDRYYGARPEQLHPQIRTELSRYIVPSTQRDLPILPNFFLEIKGPGGSSAVAALQASYVGALGARGMRTLQSYSGSKRTSGNAAYTITSTYAAGMLRLYASHPLPAVNSGARCEYVMTQIRAYALIGDADTFRTGVSAYRNARDWAKRKRDEAIKEAHEMLARRESNPSAFPGNPTLSSVPRQKSLTQLRLDPNTTSSLADPDTSADEPAVDIPSAKRARRPSEQHSVSMAAPEPST